MPRAFREAGVQSTGFSRLIEIPYTDRNSYSEIHYLAKAGTLNARYSERLRTLNVRYLNSCS